MGTVLRRVADRIAAIESAFPDAAERAQAMMDVEAFVDVMVPPRDTSFEWTEGELRLFAERFVARSGPERGAVRFRNMVRVLTLLAWKIRSVVRGRECTRRRHTGRPFALPRDG